MVKSQIPSVAGLAWSARGVCAVVGTVTRFRSARPDKLGALDSATQALGSTIPTLNKALLWSVLLWCCSGAVASAQQGPSDVQLDLIQDAVRAHSPSRRAAIAARLERELGAVAIVEALPLSFRYRPVRGRIIESTAYTAGNDKLPFYAILPPDYDPGRPWPVHVHLHGGGFVGHRACRRHFSQDHVVGFILLCPTTPRAHWWLPEGEEAVEQVLRTLQRRVNVDTTRISLGGGSSGGTGTWHIGQKFPWRWSALVPRAAGRIRHRRFVSNLLQTPVYLIHGDADGAIPVEMSRQMSAWFKEGGGRLTYREIAGGVHDFFSDLNPEVMSWAIAQRRALPTHFVFEPTRHQDHGIVHWLEVTPSGRVEAQLKTVAGQGTVVLIEAKAEPKGGAVYLNDSLADLDRPVTVMVGSRVVFSGVVERRVDVVLETFARTYDIERTFTVEIRW